MCDLCVIDAVKARMMSRRDVLRNSAAVAVGATAGTLAPPATAHPVGHTALADMTHELSEDFPTFSGDQEFFRETLLSYDQHRVNMFNLRLSEHVGTHIDAPLHFSPDGQSVAEIALTSLIAPLCVVDIAARADRDPDTRVTPEDLKSWIAKYGEIPPGACVAMHSGWARRVDGPGFRNADGDGVQHYPGFHPDTTQMLIEETAAASIAVDTMSLDHGASTTFDVHYQWLPSGRFGIENIANLDQVPAVGATLVIGAPKIRGGSGGPARIFAMM